jgi:hypothetical protein
MDMLKSIFVGLLESENVHSDNHFLDKTTIYKQNKEKPGRASNTPAVEERTLRGTSRLKYV